MVAKDRVTLSTEMCEKFLPFMSATSDESTLPTEDELVSSEISIQKSKQKRGKHLVFNLNGNLKSEHAVANKFANAEMTLKGEILVDRAGKVISIGIMGSGKYKHHDSKTYQDYRGLATWQRE